MWFKQQAACSHVRPCIHLTIWRFWNITACQSSKSSEAVWYTSMCSNNWGLCILDNLGNVWPTWASFLDATCLLYTAVASDIEEVVFAGSAIADTAPPARTRKTNWVFGISKEEKFNIQNSSAGLKPVSCWALLPCKWFYLNPLQDHMTMQAFWMLGIWQVFVIERLQHRHCGKASYLRMRLLTWKLFLAGHGSKLHMQKR